LGHPPVSRARLHRMDVDWDAWTPADHAAAEAIAGPRLRELLDAAGIELPFAKSRIGELSAILQATLTSEVTTREMGGPVPVTNSVQSLARQLETLLDNPADAAPLAHTLTALAQSAAAIAGYLKYGVRHVEWSSAQDDKVCPGCRANAAAGPVPIGEQFPSGTVMPPGCQGCRCALLAIW
jgi:hypothetical protein